MKFLKGKFEIIVENRKINEFKEELRKLIAKYSYTATSNSLNVYTSQNIDSSDRTHTGRIYLIDYDGEEQEFIVLRSTKKYIVGIVVGKFEDYDDLLVNDYEVLRLKYIENKGFVDVLDAFAIEVGEVDPNEIESIDLKLEGSISHNSFLVDLIMKYKEYL